MSNDNDLAIDLADRGLLSLAYAYALDAVGNAERSDIEARVQAAHPQTRRSFEVAVAEVRETMAMAASMVATTPPTRLRPRLLDEISLTAEPPCPERVESRGAKWRFVIAAAAVAIGVTAIPAAIGHDASTDSTEQVLIARDSRTATTDVIGGGAATVTYSLQQNAAVVRFDDVAPPPAGTVYQLWLVDGPPRPAGTVSAADLAQDNRHRIDNIGAATAFAVTVEQGSGSDIPTRNPIAAIELS